MAHSINPKFPITKHETSTNDQKLNIQNKNVLNFEFVSDFDIRISNLYLNDIGYPFLIFISHIPQSPIRNPHSTL
jgi:hypothetical protein